MFKKKNILVNFHPVTLEKNTSSSQIVELIGALKKFKDVGILFTMPNADHGNRVIYDKINSFVKKSKNAKAFKSLGILKYLSCLRLVDVIIGNSSSGLLEAPTLKIPTINIGDRQKSRLKSKSVIDCLPKKNKIFFYLQKILSKRRKFNINSFKRSFNEI